MGSRSALAELRALRKSGKTRLSNYNVAEEEKIYEEVDEEGYKKVVRNRLDQDDFVVDDNGEGYADDGREDWLAERRPQYETESEEERPLKGKAGMLFLAMCWQPSSRDARQPSENAKKIARSRRRPTIASTSTSTLRLPRTPQSRRYVRLQIGRVSVADCSVSSLLPLPRTTRFWPICWAKSMLML
jgi:hypothetical protein